MKSILSKISLAFVFFILIFMYGCNGPVKVKSTDPSNEIPDEIIVADEEVEETEVEENSTEDPQTNYIEELEARIDELEESLLFFVESITNYQEVTDSDLEKLRLEFIEITNTVIINQNKINDLEAQLLEQSDKLTNIERELLKIQILEVKLDEFQAFVNTNFVNDGMLEDKFLEVVDIINSFSDSFLAQNNELLDRVTTLEVMMGELDFYSRDDVDKIIQDLKAWVNANFRKKK